MRGCAQQEAVMRADGAESPGTLWLMLGESEVLAGAFPQWAIGPHGV